LQIRYGIGSPQFGQPVIGPVLTIIPIEVPQRAHVKLPIASGAFGPSIGRINVPH
jgi:hypothetical protein